MICQKCGLELAEGSQCPKCAGKQDVPEKVVQTAGTENGNLKEKRNAEEEQTPTPVESDQEILPASGTGEKKQIDQQVNAEHVGSVFSRAEIENINFNYSSDLSAGKERKRLFLEPTRELTGTSFSNIYRFKPSEEIETNIQRLIEKRVILLASLDDEVTRAMTCTILMDSAFDDYERRLLAFTGNNAERNDLHLDIFIVEKIGRGDKLAVLVEIEEQKGFFDSLFGHTLSIQRTQEILREKNIILICLVKTSLMEKVSKEEEGDFIFHRWDVDCLPYLLEMSFPQMPNLESVIKDILDQRIYGLWDKKKDDKEFLKIISGYIHLGEETFKEEVEARREYMAGGKKPGGFLVAAAKVKPEELFTESKLHRSVLYAAAFFDKLSPIDFSKIVVFLVGEKTKTEDQEHQVIKEKGEKESQRIITRKTEKSLKKVWDERPDEILKECHLKSIKLKGMTHVIEFSSPYLKNEIKEYIETEYPMFLREQFVPFLNTGAVFDEELSPQLRENIIRLTVEMARINPTYYGGDWFLYFIRRVKDTLNSQIEEHLEQELPPTEDKNSRIHRNIEYIENARAQMFQFYGYLADLIREMLNHSQLQGMINDFLNKLFTEEEYNEVLDIVYQLGKRLRFAPGFDPFKWIKRILELDNDVRENGRGALILLAVQGKYEVYELFEKVIEWLPDKDLDSEDYSFSNIAALLFVIDYSKTTIQEYELKFYGQWPSSYSIFYTLHKSRELARERLTMMVEWLLNPGIQDAFDILYPEKNYNAEANIGLLVVEWTRILLGKDIKKAHPDAEATFDLLLRLIYEKADKKQRKGIMKFWGSERSFFRNRMIALSSKEKKEKVKKDKEFLKNLYQVISKLIHQFKRLKTLESGRR